jgi:hypothetical protein
MVKPTMTQAEHVLALLERGPVCSSAIYDRSAVTHRLAARVYDLRRAGHMIVSRPCSDAFHHHGRSRMVEYRLEDSTHD